MLPLSSSEYIAEPVTSADCKLIADHYPDRFLWFCNVDPRAAGNRPTADLSPLLMHYKSLGAKGVGEVTANLFFDDPLMDNFFYHCAACDLPVTVHIATKIGGCYGVVDDFGLPRLEKMRKKHKDLIILGHAQAFWSEISADVDEKTRGGNPHGKVKEGRIAALLRKYENRYCDLSAGSGFNALFRDPDYGARFIEEFSDRLLYGCDVYFASNRHPFFFADALDRLLSEGAISPENFRKLVRGNAEKLLCLS